MCEQNLLTVEICKCATFYVNGCKLIVRSMQVKQNFQNETSIWNRGNNNFGIHSCDISKSHSTGMI